MGRIATTALPADTSSVPEPGMGVPGPVGGQFGQQWDEQQYAPLQSAYQYGNPNDLPQVKGPESMSTNLVECSLASGSALVSVWRSTCPVSENACNLPMTSSWRAACATCDDAYECGLSFLESSGIRCMLSEQSPPVLPQHHSHVITNSHVCKLVVAIQLSFLFFGHLFSTRDCKPSRRLCTAHAN